MRKKAYEGVEIRKVANQPCANCTKIFWYITECREDGAEIKTTGIKIESCTGFEDYRDKAE